MLEKCKVVNKNKIFNTNGAIIKNKANNEDNILVSGDHREEISEFLIHEGIGTKETIRVHGFVV